MATPLRQIVNCKCGKIQLDINSPSALRIVCYSQDYRGYYNTLNDQARSKHQPANAKLDPWGGVDLTQIYPSEIKVQQGGELLQPCLIRKGSPVRRVYATCCDTPMFDIGGLAAMVNTDLLDEDDTRDVRFRIIGRQALKTAAVHDDEKEIPKKPKMSWSIPLSWIWTMSKRIQKDKMEPYPIDVSNPKLLENFKLG